VSHALPVRSIWRRRLTTRRLRNTTMDSVSHYSLVPPLPDPALALRRQMLVSGLFAHVSEVHDIEQGYAFKFRRTESLARRIADYLLFEAVNSPQLFFVLIVEPYDGALWLRLCGPSESKAAIRNRLVQQASSCP